MQNQKPINIRAYMQSAEERFSGFNGYEDEMNAGFVADDFDLDADGTGAVASAGMSPSPYSVVVTNSTGGTLTAVLFGNNTNLLATNFGSAVGITVTPAQTNVSYLQLLQQSAFQPFETGLVRIQTTVTTQLTQILTLTTTDANGNSATSPLITSNYFSAYQQQNGILDVPFAIRIDGNTSISFPVLASTSVTLTFFPSEKINPARALAGQGAKKQYGRPAVPMVQPVYTNRQLGFGGR